MLEKLEKIHADYLLKAGIKAARLIVQSSTRRQWKLPKLFSLPPKISADTSLILLQGDAVSYPSVGLDQIQHKAGLTVWSAAFKIRVCIQI